MLEGINPFGLIGGLLGASSSGNQTQTVNRDPWGPAQPYLLSNIDSASKLQNYYQQNPISSYQQRAYSNSFNGTDSARQGLSSLSSQLGNNRGWSRNSGSRLPQGYNFLPIGYSATGQSGLFGGMSSGIPSNPFNGSGIVSNTPMAYRTPAPAPAKLPPDHGEGSSSSGGGISPTGTVIGDLTLAGLSGLFGLPGRVLGSIALNPVTGYVAQQSVNARNEAISKDPTFGGGGYTGPGGTTSPTGGGAVSFGANPMAVDPATAQGQSVATNAALGGNDGVGYGGGSPSAFGGGTIGGVSIGALGDPASTASASDGGGGGGGKIICTAMNEAYGFGSYRQAVWLKYSERMTKEHERGYHRIFLPLVKYAFKSGDGVGNRIVRKVLEHGTRHRTADLRAEMYGRKRDLLGRLYRAIFEPICYVVGKV